MKSAPLRIRTAVLKAVFATGRNTFAGAAHVVEDALITISALISAVKNMSSDAMKIRTATTGVGTAGVRSRDADLGR